jgi:hypothetical protein
MPLKVANFRKPREYLECVTLELRAQEAIFRFHLATPTILNLSHNAPVITASFPPMIDLQMNWLTNIGLRFPEQKREAAFVDQFCLKKKLQTQVAFFFGGLIFYVFYIWDDIIDVHRSGIPYVIRSSFVILTWAGGLALFSRSIDKIFEIYCVLFVTAAGVLLAVIYHFLAAGFSFGAVGIVLTMFFAFSLFPVRFPFFTAFCVVTWGSFVAIEWMSADFSAGMLLVNSLSIGTAVFLGLFSAYVQETAARNAFDAQDKLNLADTRVDELLQSIARHDLNVAISYRRIDAEAMAGRIRDRLVSHFGEASVFMDIDSIPVGVDFRDHVRNEIGAADIVLAIIGPAWLGRKNRATRIVDPEDPVRVELEIALQMGIPIIPILIFGASMPAAKELPPSLESLSFRNAIDVGAGRDFHHHMDRLVKVIAGTSPHAKNPELRSAGDSSMSPISRPIST